MKYKVGDKIRVIAQIDGHCFTLGTKCIITDSEDNPGGSYYCTDKDGFRWWLCDEEIQLID